MPALVKNHFPGGWAERALPLLQTPSQHPSLNCPNCNYNCLSPPEKNSAFPQIWHETRFCSTSSKHQHRYKKEPSVAFKVRHNPLPEHPSLYRTQLGAFGASILPPSALAMRPLEFQPDLLTPPVEEGRVGPPINQWHCNDGMQNSVPGARWSP